MNVFSYAAMGVIKAYQYFLSPLLPAACRFTPTCSEYAAEAISWHGLFKGAYLAAGRIARCHPASPLAYDPVPVSQNHQKEEEYAAAKK